jgi:hypothetical protein
MDTGNQNGSQQGPCSFKAKDVDATTPETSRVHPGSVSPHTGQAEPACTQTAPTSEPDNIFVSSPYVLDYSSPTPPNQLPIEQVASLSHIIQNIMSNATPAQQTGIQHVMSLLDYTDTKKFASRFKSAASMSMQSQTSTLLNGPRAPALPPTSSTDPQIASLSTADASKDSNRPPRANPIMEGNRHAHHPPQRQSKCLRKFASLSSRPFPFLT